MSTSDLQGRRALVTGSVQGIGLAIAEALAAQGAAVVLHGLARPGELEAARAALRQAGAPQVDAFAHDLRQPDQVEALVNAALAGGAVDILVNNAGIQHTAALAQMPRAKWDDILAVNLSAAFDTMRLLLPRMAEAGYGRVVNIASVHGLVASVQKAPYVAAKFGLVGLSRVAALEYAAAGLRASGGVTVNCVCPGWTETAIIQPQIDARAAALGASRDDAIRDLLREKQPSGRTSLPQEIARVVCWLCEPAAHNLTGASIPVDGGWTAQ
ncbi:3-hydroxybutyrate dehydrogenase [Ramlibacter tataouinensis]|uniref:3-hydroxybutyrate dehydrogenase n=1 Tax=Ramlibacter tataouinensis TaxID=94132 RepID=UPI0022F3E301|nr:3-hydroxybutyrate dehydrogenase [Ramlibacter tataouinensis]WBY01355.1 3-hydroxybutyrate dehydrogenase [Ramlibacter tataouinensis]